jgi:cation/acetate symporter
MPKYLLLLEDKLFIETGLTGRLVFGLMAYGLWLTLILILDRIGLPIQISFVLSMVFCLISMALMGLLVRTMRSSAFYVLNRRLGMWYGAMSMAGMVCALILPELINGGDTSLPAQAGAVLVGFFIFGLITAPLLRRTNALTPLDVIKARFPSAALTWLLIGASVLSSGLIAAAGFELTLDWLSTLYSFERINMAWCLGLMSVVCFAAGGQRAITWISLALFCTIVPPLTLPLLVSTQSLAHLPLPIIADEALWQKATQIMQQWMSHHDIWHWPALILLAVGLSTLMPLTMSALAMRSPATARGASWVAGVLSAGVIMLCAAGLANSSLGLENQVVNRSANDVPLVIYQASRAHLLSLCEQNPSSPALGYAMCNRDGAHPNLSPDDLRVSPAGLMLAVPGLTPSLLALSGIIFAALTGLALVLCAANIMACAVLLGQDFMRHTSAQPALTSKRLALTRLFMIITLVSVGVSVTQTSLDPTDLIAASFALSLSLYVPLYVLAFMWRVETSAALCATLSAVVIGAIMIVFQGTPSTWDGWASLSGVTSTSALCLGLIISFIMPARDPITAKAFVYAILHGHTDIYRHEEL